MELKLGIQLRKGCGDFMFKSHLYGIEIHAQRLVNESHRV